VAEASATASWWIRRTRRRGGRRWRTIQFPSSIPFAAIPIVRAFNSRLTTCDDASGLLAAFVERASTSSKDKDDGIVVARSAATHLAVVGRINSVNFSTCLHRLAKVVSSSPPAQFASNPGNTNGEDNPERRRARALSDLQFALLVCSMAEMACGIDLRHDEGLQSVVVVL